MGFGWAEACSSGLGKANGGLEVIVGVVDWLINLHRKVCLRGAAGRAVAKYRYIDGCCSRV